MFGNKVHHVLHKVHKRWLVVGITALALGLTTTLTTAKAADTVSINYVSGYSVAVWQRANGVQATSKKLPTGTRWASYGAVQQGDNDFYLNVGGDQWIDSNYADLAGENSSQEMRGVVTIQYVPGYGIAVWNSASGDRQIVRRAVLRHGTQWQIYRRAVVNGRTWYNLGGNQWIDGGFAKLTAQEYRGLKTYQSGGPTVIKPTEPTKPAPSTPIVQKVSYRVVTRDQYGTIVSTRIYEGNIGDTITISATGIDGYTLNDGSTKTIRLSADSGQNDIDFTYTRNTPSNLNQGSYVPPAVTQQYVNYRILAVDDQGQPIQGYIPTTGSSLPRAAINAPTIPGYTVSGARTINVGVSGGDVKFIYTKDTVKDVSYTIKAVDDQGVAIASFTSDTKSGQPGATISAPSITGYTVTGASTAPIPIAGGPITFKYTKNTPTTPATVTYQIKAVDEQEQPITAYTAQDTSGKPGDSITAPTIPGYTIQGSSTAQIPATGGPITFKYTKNAPAPVSYTIKIVDEQGNPITGYPDQTGQGAPGTPIPVPPVTGYTIKPPTTATVPAAGGVVTFTYTQDAPAVTTVKYTIAYVDEDKQPITTTNPASGEGKVGDPISAPDIDGYTATAETAKQTLAAETTKITYIYTKNPAATVKYTIEYLDQVNKQAITTSEPASGEGKAGDPVSAPNIDGYTVTAATAQQTLAADTVKITYIYMKNAPATVTYTINFVDQSNGKVQEPQTGVIGKVGDTIPAPTITGYTASTAAQTLKADTTELTFVYSKDAPATVNYTIQYLEGGNAITTTEPTSGEGKAGDLVTAPNIPGYTADPSSTKQTLQADTTNIKFTYTKNAFKYAIAYLDQDNKAITTSEPASGEGKAGDSVTAPNIAGYTVTAATAKQTLAADTGTITFRYTQNAPATVTYTTSFVDQLGAQIKDPQTGVVGKVGDDVTAPTIDGYTADTATATQTLKADTTAIKFTYTQNAPATITYTISFVDEGGVKIQDPKTGVTGKVGDEIFATDVPGYTAPTAAQVLKADTTALTFTYTKKAVQTTVQFVGSTSGKAIADPVQVTTKQTYPAKQILTGKDGNFYILLDGQKTAIDPATQPTLTLKYKLIAGTMNAVDEHGTVIKELTSGLTPLILRSDGYYWISYPAQFRIFDTAGNEYDLTDPNRGGSAGWVQTPLYDSTFPHTYTLSYKKVVGPITEFTDQEKQAMAQLRSSYNALAKPVLTNGLYTTMPTYKPFNAGSTTTAFQQQTIGIWNFFRAIWGLPAVTTDSAVSATDQVASSFMAGYMAGLQHTVDGYTQPSDMTDNDWIKVQNGLMSNLATVSGQNTQVDQLIMGFLADNHNLKGNDAGHRLNMLRPSLLTSGVGLGFSTNAAATGQKGQSNLSLDVLKGASSQATYSANNGVMFYPGAGVFPIELLPTDTIGGKIAYTPISAASYGGVDLRKVTKVTVADLTANQSADLTGIYNKDTNPGGQLIFGGSGNSDTYGDANTTITATGYTFVNQHAYRITFYGDGLPGGSISTTFKTFSFAG